MRPPPAFLSSSHPGRWMAAIRAGVAPAVARSVSLETMSVAHRNDALRLAAYLADRAWVCALLPKCGTFMPALDGLAVRCAENPRAPLTPAQEGLLDVLLFPVDHPQWLPPPALHALHGKQLRFLEILRRAAAENALELSAAVLARAHVGHWLELCKTIPVLAAQGHCAVLDQVLAVHAASRTVCDALWTSAGNPRLSDEVLSATVAVLVSRLNLDREASTLLTMPPPDLLPSEVARRTARLLAVFPVAVLEKMPPAQWSGSAPARARMMDAELPPPVPGASFALVRL